MFVPFELVGRRFGKYQVSEFIGRGPMAYVFRAYDPETQQTLALKLFPKAWPESAENEAAFRETFFRELETARRLVHPNVASILEVGENEEFHYLVGEFIPGKTLEEIINEQGPIPLEEALPLFRQILEGLEAAHQKNLVHRNLKPSNILVKRDGRIKLTDFAQAKIPSMAATMSFSGAGSPYYMSPEQLLGQRGDIRSDIFSVGALLYRILTGERPFNGETTATIVDRVVHTEVIPPKALNPHIPVALDQLCTRAMAKDPADRYQTPGAMLADLEAFEPAGTAEGFPTLALERSGRDPLQTEALPRTEFIQTEIIPAQPPGSESGVEADPIAVGQLPETSPEPGTADSAEPSVPEVPPEVSPRRWGLKGIGLVLSLLLIVTVGAVLALRWTRGLSPLPAPTGTAVPAPASPPVVYTLPKPSQPPPLPGNAGHNRPADPVLTTEQLLTQARAAWNTDLHQARSLLERAVVQSPDHFEAHFQLGRLLTQQKRYPAALQAYQQALNLNNRVPEVYFNLGYIHLIQGNYDLAIQHLEWCRALNPPYQDEVLTNIGVIHLRKGNLLQARLYLKEAVKLNPRNDLARNYLRPLESDGKEHKKKDHHE